MVYAKAQRKNLSPDDKRRAQALVTTLKQTHRLPPISRPSRGSHGKSVTPSLCSHSGMSTCPHIGVW